MLHAPISETKTETASGKAQKATQPERVLSNTPSLSAGMQRRQSLMDMQSTHGNQAVLQLMRSPQQIARTPAIRPSQSVMIQRTCACGGTPGPTGECAACKAKREASEAQLQSKAANPTLVPSVPATAATHGVPSIVHDVICSPGQALDTNTRAFMEPRFGHDFSRVRIHTDARAAESAQAVNALAYTVGSHVVFGAGQHQPETSQGKRLMAHELTHVMQQSSQRNPQNNITIGAIHDVYEQEADKVTAYISDSDMLNSTPILSMASDNLQRFSSSESSQGGIDEGADATVDAGTDASAATSSSCKVDVRATHIGGILSGLPIWHLFIVYTDSTGKESFFRGGPGGSCPGVDAGSYGTIKSTSGAYTAGTVDWNPGGPTITVMKGTGACGKDSCFRSQLSRIDALCLPYSPGGPNSNTVASTLLSQCSVPLDKPVMVTPGWSPDGDDL